ncbi:hypothetical protein ACJIZ3_025566 [Penstemon smallii]|uniref:Epidermal patterning factor-like protein n=1 Tax=Penstemon smallii TaxID=265156 RepID=A0ABD3TVY3_9LAMI
MALSIARNYHLCLSFSVMAIIFFSLTFLPPHESGGGIESSSSSSSNGEELRKMVLGSRPPACLNKCMSCRPCDATLETGNLPKMATCTFPLPTSINHHHHHSHHGPPPIYNCAATTTTKRTTFCFSYPYSYSTTLNLHRSFPLKSNSRSSRCHATSPESEPPSTKQPPPSSGVVATFTKFQDTLQIFFAVLFWMSLFFWSCAWDGRDDGRPNKGSRFRK